jgi:hypothetical protein
MKTMNIPERFTGTIYIAAYCDPTDVMYGWLYFTDREPSKDSDLILLGQTEVDIPLDAKGTVDKQVAKLRRSKQKIIDDATDRASQIDEAIESLLAIEHQEAS